MNHAEHYEQCSLLTWSRTLEHKYPALKRLYANVNAGTASARHGAWLKAEGRKAGVSDLFLACPARGKHGLYIELKAGKGKATPEQMEWITESNRLGYEAYVAVGWIRAAQIIGAYLDMAEKECPK